MAKNEKKGAGFGLVIILIIIGLVVAVAANESGGNYFGLGADVQKDIRSKGVVETVKGRLGIEETKGKKARQAGSSAPAVRSAPAAKKQEESKPAPEHRDELGRSDRRELDELIEKVAK